MVRVFPCVSTDYERARSLRAVVPRTNEDVIRVRIKCFRLAAGEFYFPPQGQMQGYVDAVVVGEIEPEDVCFVSHITPMIASSPFNLEHGLDVCSGQPVHIAGWGKTVDASCASILQQRLLVGTSSIVDITCALTSGRHGSMELAEGECSTEKQSCTTQPNTGDSGGAVAVEIPDGSLRLIGVLRTPTEAFIAIEHQSLTPSPGSAYLCRPCRPRPCGDINGDGFETFADRIALMNQGAHDVACWCLGDMNGNGCSGDPQDLSMIACPLCPFMCNRNQWCYGDANLDGSVNEADYQFVAANISYYDEHWGGQCPSCTICEVRDWCRGDLNCDGFVDANDLAEVRRLVPIGSPGYPCSRNEPECAATNPPCP